MRDRNSDAGRATRSRRWVGSRRALAVVALSVCALTAVALAPAASADKKKLRTMKIDARILAEDESEYDGDVLACTYALFAEWNDQSHAKSWEVHATNLINGSAFVQTTMPPFDDLVVFDDPSLPLSRTFTAPEGFHRLMITYGGAIGPRYAGGDCRDAADRVQRLYGYGYVFIRAKVTKCEKLRRTYISAKNSWRFFAHNHQDAEQQRFYKDRAHNLKRKWETTCHPPD